MFKVYPNNEIGDVRGPLKVANNLSDMAKRLKDLIQKQLVDGQASEFGVSYATADVVLDFRLATPFGYVFARYDPVRLDKNLVGRYMFFFEDRDEQNIPVCKPVFMLLFTAEGRYQLGGSSTSNLADYNFQAVNDDFIWRLVGNLLLGVYEQFDAVNSSIGISSRL